MVISAWGDFERAGSESYVDPYHRFFAPISNHVAPALLDRARAGDGMHVLDVCSGPGYVAGAAAARGAHAHGVDIAARMVELARALVPQATFVVADAEELPYPDRAFDAVVCNFGLHHLPRPRRAVAEVGRVLRPGGRFAMSVWDEEINDLAIVPAAIYGAGAVVPSDIPSPPPQPSYEDDDDVLALLDGSNLILVGKDAVEFSHTFASAGELWDGWLAAAIRTGPVLAAQSPEVKHRARQAFDEKITALSDQDGRVSARIRVLLVTARRREPD